MNHFNNPKCVGFVKPALPPQSNEKVRDHDHVTGKYRRAAHNRWNLNCKQKSSSFVPILFHNFSGYDCHNIFEELLTQA